jgi:hypothetical protein
MSRKPTNKPSNLSREEAMERDLLSSSGQMTHCIWFDLDGLMRGDSAARASFNGSMLQNGVFSRNEVRISEGKNPVDKEGMDDYTVQTNMAMIQLLDTLNKAAAGQQTKGATNGNQD